MNTTTKAALREMLAGRSRGFWGMVLLIGIADIAWDYYSPRGVVIDVIGLAVLLVWLRSRIRNRVRAARSDPAP